MAGLAWAGCGQPPAAREICPRTAKPEPMERTADSLPASQEIPVWGDGKDQRLPFPVLTGEYKLGLPQSSLPTSNFQLTEDATDSLHNLVLAPEDWENGWGWARDVFQAMSPELRSAYIDQVASVTPAWAWGRLDSILDQPGWGPDVLHALYNRMLELPLSEQLPRLLRIAKNRSHPCWEQADSLLQVYLPNIANGNHGVYQRRINEGASW